MSVTAVPTVRRILTIDDNDAIHGDFKKILCPDMGSAKLNRAKALLFGGGATAPTAPAGPRFEVDSALQGEEGFLRLQKAVQEKRPYSVAFVDMRMPPGWDGLQTIQRLWEVDPDVQVVICSAYSDYSWDDIVAKLGLTDQLLILKKPFDPAEVTQLAAALSEKWALRRAAKQHIDHLEQLVQERTVELTHLAMHDKLTGLGNRNLFNERLSQAVSRARSESDYQFAALFLDFDRFKLINDSLGHDAGDAVLKGIAERITAALSYAGAAVGQPAAARLGGDEFAILIDATATHFEPVRFADTLVRLLAAPYTLDSRKVFCTASIGLTSSEIGYGKPADVLRDADTAMYRAKAAGKNCCVVFDRRMHEEAAAHLELENDLRQALGRDELTLNYQPIVSLESGKPVGFEALLRWQHPIRGTVPPGDFIKCCEEIGIIGKIGLWVLERACEQLRNWTLKFPQLPDLSISVNLSAKQLADPDLPQHIQQIINRTGVKASSVAMEITESAMIGDPQTVIPILNEIRSIGIRLHLDDFGTGYSSLSALHQYPINAVKIDRSFVKSTTERRDYMAVVHAIINLARHLNMQLIAEGIETPEQVCMLQAMDCEYAQGFHFGRPMDAASSEHYLRGSLTHRRGVIGRRIVASINR